MNLSSLEGDILLEVNMDIGTRIKYYRTREGFTQAKLAELAEMEPNNLNRIENGKASPKLLSFVKICDALNVTPNELLLYEYNAPIAALISEIAQLLEGCSEEEYKKIIDYIYYVRKFGR